MRAYPGVYIYVYVVIPLAGPHVATIWMLPRGSYVWTFSVVVLHWFSLPLPPSYFGSLYILTPTSFCHVVASAVLLSSLVTNSAPGRTPVLPCLAAKPMWNAVSFWKMLATPRRWSATTTVPPLLWPCYHRRWIVLVVGDQLDQTIYLHYFNCLLLWIYTHFIMQHLDYSLCIELGFLI